MGTPHCSVSVQACLPILTVCSYSTVCSYALQSQETPSVAGDPISRGRALQSQEIPGHGHLPVELEPLWTSIIGLPSQLALQQAPIPSPREPPIVPGS